MQLTNRAAQRLLPHLPLAPAVLEDKTQDELDDEFKVRLAAALTAAARRAGLTLLVTYASVHECEVFHSLFDFDAAGRLGCAPKDVSDKPWPKDDLRTYMRRRHPDKVVFGPDWPPAAWKNEFTQEELVAKLLKSQPNAKGERFGGFLLVRGGKQRCGDDVDPMMGYCMQRSRVSVSDLGAMTRWQAAQMCDGDEVAAKALLERYCKNEQTTCRTAYPMGAGELIGVDLFRFLVTQKGFHGYEIQHFIHYNHAGFMDSFLERLQQMRHDLKR